MKSEGPRYHFAAACATEIINFHSEPGMTDAERFGKILYCILWGMYQAEQEMQRAKLEPSKN